jgi:imidazolonepropionase-like amidohydrolase
MSRTLFENVTVLDGSGKDPFRGHVTVEGNRIKQVAKASAKVSRDDAEVVDGSGCTLMPGLVEAHGHLSFTNVASLEALGDIPPEEHTLLTAKNAKLLLDQGFTSVNSAASAKPRLDVVVRNAIEEGMIPGPRLLAASPELTVTAGLGDVRRLHIHRDTFSIVCDGADEFRKAARTMCREGVDTLKMNPSGDQFVPFAKAEDTVMTNEEMVAVVEVARQHRKRVMTHARSAESIKMSVRNGIPLINHATIPDEEAIDLLESAKDTVFVIPGIGVAYATIYEASDWGITEKVAEDMGWKYELEQAIPAMKEYKRRGIRVVPGGDYGFAWNPQGTNARDIEHFVNLFGFSPMEAICAATKTGGEIMMRGNELGQVRTGYLADLLLVDGDPVKDVKILQDRDKLLGIMKDGSFHKKPAERRQARRLAAE